ncbi:substrate-binding periplasmic protein [Vibrio superstes]|nr:transporter substrate-binding domain-containing protein [Vibrio superstes]
MTPKQSEADVSHDYLVQLVSKSTKLAEPHFGPSKIEFMPIMLSQDRVLQLLGIGGVLDIVASAPTDERESSFLSVKVPIFMGLLGYRMMIIAPSKLGIFESITKEEELKNLIACQGTAWPDADILEDSGYRVLRVTKFEQMFEKLHSGECDYFPRAITEGYGELEYYNENNPDKPLAKFDSILIHYQVPLMFYTSHNNYELAAKIQYGMEQMVINGELEALLKTHPVTQSAFPLSKWDNAKIFSVPNKRLPKSVPTFNKAMWLSLD